MGAMSQSGSCSQVAVRRASFRLTPESGRVLIQPFDLRDEQKSRRVIQEVLERPHDEIVDSVKCLLEEFDDRHVDLAGVFSKRFLQVQHLLPPGARPSNTERLLIGAHFMSEYALESAALFNPSVVPHPDQSGVAADSLRIIMSLRATGEGHISSIEFRSGIVDGLGNVSIDPSIGCVTRPLTVDHTSYEREAIRDRLAKMGLLTAFFEHVLEALGPTFSLEEAEHQIEKSCKDIAERPAGEHEIGHYLVWLARCNYEVRFGVATPISQRVIFPQGRASGKGSRTPASSASPATMASSATTRPTQPGMARPPCPSSSRPTTSSISRCAPSAANRYATRGWRCSPARSTESTR